MLILLIASSVPVLLKHAGHDIDHSSVQGTLIGSESGCNNCLQVEETE